MDYNSSSREETNIFILREKITSVAKTGVNQIDSLISGVKWKSNTITYSFPTSKDDYSDYSSGDEQDHNFVALNSDQQAAARNALSEWSSVCNLTFTEETGDDGKLRFGTSSQPSTSWAYTPSNYSFGGDVWFGNTGDNAPSNPVTGSYDYATYIHEIGHALGLKHPHGTNGSGVVAKSSIDSIEFSIMSYRSYEGADINGYTLSADSFPTSIMMNDIAAIQYMYGANFNYNAGATVYTFDPTQSKIFETIWDGNGIDTYDLSAYTTNLKIDLRPGEWSTFDTSQLAYLGDGHYARGNVANALLYNGDTRSLIDNATGGSGNDNIIGNQVDNVLDGGLGVDTLIGGKGNDTYVVDNTGDVLVEKVGEGTDTVKSSISYTLGVNLENLTLTGTDNINGTGNSVNNVLTGNSGNNVLDGGLGIDTMAGGTGNDTYVVDNMKDVVLENADAGTDTVYSNLASYTLGANLENLTLTGVGNINGIGNELDNILTGNKGNNLLNGGLGADTLIGGLGNDSYVVDNNGDGVEENAGEGTDTVYSNLASYTLGDNLENLILTGTESINGTGNSINNVITGNGGNNVLDGGVGADTMTGGKGDDTYVVDNVKDVVAEKVGEGTDTVKSSISYTLGANLENLTLVGTDNINGTGNNVNNVLTGNSGNNVLDGGLGIDTMTGGTGNDTYVVDNMKDVVVENADAGTDTVYSNLASYTLGANLENLTLTGVGNINGTGNELDNIITGNSGNNILTGGLGSDRLIGGKGNDSYVIDSSDVVEENAGEGTDTVYSNLASYTLGDNFENLILTGTESINGTGNSINNVITGNGGNNVLDGGVGADTMTGGKGDDTYVVDHVKDVVAEKAGEGTDTVKSSISYTLGANVENLTLTGTDNINGTGNSVNNVLTGNDGNNILNGGAGADYMAGGLGDDSYVIDSSDVIVENEGEGTDTVNSSLANYTLGDNLENLTLTGTGNINGTGNELSNVITGNKGNNILTGGAGDDTLNGGLGADTMMGGTGNDTYVVDNTKDVVVENAEEGTDTVNSNLINYILGDNLENLTLTGTGNINATGNGLDNVITGNSGNNILNGGLGADTLIGGFGNDSYVINSSSDVIVENANQGIDTVNSNLASYTLGDNLENLILSGTENINGTGNSVNNVITGNIGKNILDGGLGADTMIGGKGDDTYVVDNAKDVVGEKVGEGTDTVEASINYTLGVNLENLTLTGTGNINGTGNSVNNVITGNDGNNILNGGLGADTLIGGLGDDVYVIDNIKDVVVENAEEGTDTVNSNLTNYTLGDNLENLTLTGTGNINGTGNGLDNVITGNKGNNILNGGEGADTLIGDFGNDSYVINSSSDVIVENANQGIDTVNSNLASYTLGDNLENLILSGTESINGIGNSINNVITGNIGNNIIDGGLGADTMIGGKGDDTYVVDNAKDVVVEKVGEGTDTVESSINYTLGANVENLTLTGTNNINGTGNSVNNVLTGNNGNNILNGGLGADTLIGGLGDDSYVIDSSDVIVENEGEGTDTVNSNLANYTLGDNLENLTLTGTGNINGIGNELSNVITGNKGNNILTGGAGDDTLNGGLGADTMIGGTGNDTYVVDNAKDVVVENAEEGTDTVNSNLTNYILGDNLENLTLTGTGNINGTGNGLDNVITGNKGNNILNGGLGADTLIGGLGNDTLYGGAGNDILEGGLGDDTYIFGAGSGNDTIISYEGISGNGFDTLLFQNIAIAGMAFEKNADDLICTLMQTGEKVDLSNWFLGSNYEIDRFKFSDGTLTSAQIDKKFA